MKNEPYLVEVKAGDAEFFEEMVAYVAGLNMTPYPRRAWPNTTHAADTTYCECRSVLPDELVENQRDGDVIPRHEQLSFLFPYCNDDLT